MDRWLIDPIKNDVKKKIILITGPRQCGKTTLSLKIGEKEKTNYLNFDNKDHRTQILKGTWDRGKELLIFDEIHKMKNWKRWLKGIYDVEKEGHQFIVTGSAKLDVYRKFGDSLAGRFFQYHLYPMDLLEFAKGKKLGSKEAKEVIQTLMNVGGFLEPFLEGTKSFYNRWKKGHLDLILRQDLLEFENVRDIISLEILIELLRERVGSVISYKNLSEELQTSDKTIKRWLTLLENSYIIFKVLPFSKNIAKSVLKQPKFYFYDIAQVKNEAARFENLLALTILKDCYYRQDVLGEESEFFFLKNSQGHEMDFYYKREDRQDLIEVKLSNESVSPHFKWFAPYFPGAQKFQVVLNLEQNRVSSDLVKICGVENYILGLIPSKN